MKYIHAEVFLNNSNTMSEKKYWRQVVTFFVKNESNYFFLTEH